MKGNLRTVFAVAVVWATALGAPVVVQGAACPDGADYTGRECLPTTDDCDGTASMTEATARVGGQGSIGTETDPGCGVSPGTDAEGNIVEADLQFKWTRSSETAGQLELLVTNVTCDTTFESGATITEIWFNTPTNITGCTLASATRNRGTENKSVNWSLEVANSPVGCIGKFDWHLKRSGGSVIANGALPDDSIQFVINCAGADLVTDHATACDIANDGSSGEVGERQAQVALHFQRSDDDFEHSAPKVTSNCAENLYVELASIDAYPSNGEVRIDWTTAMEIDTAGFFVLRRNVLTNRTVRLNAGLIPAQGDLNQGAVYSFTDRTAVNGVRYEYILVDVENSGLEGRHPGITAVANPTNPRIRLGAPAHGTAGLAWSVHPTFSWTGPTSRDAVLQVSNDPTFDNSLAIALRSRRASEITLNAVETRQLEKMAEANQGVVYWRVLDSSLGSEAAVSETFSVGYGVTRPDGDRGAHGVEVTGSNGPIDAARSERALVRGR